MDLMAKGVRSPVLRYRPEIDGMRSVAVLLVLLFHAKIPGFSGGYVGVDIFFVISGYLITLDIVRRRDQEGFSLISFWFRRIRRIFPALVATILGTLALAALVFPAPEFIRAGKMAIAAILSLGNIGLYHQNGYFHPSSHESPFLHTWSLGVEEQFYLVWPLVILATLRFGGRRALAFVIGSIIVLSLSFAQFMLSRDASFAFYMLPTRAWELATGGLLAMATIRGIRSVAPHTAIAGTLVGLAMIMTAGMTYTDTTPFPGVAALLPCVGAALIIATGDAAGNPAGQLLAHPVMTFLGRISYSLYLIHWPILVFAGAYWIEGIDLAGRVGLMLVSVILAYLSWRFVENPVRRFSSSAHQWRRWVSVAVGSVGVVGIVSVGIILTNGLPSRGPSPAWLDRSATQYARFQESPCLARGANIPASRRCAVQPSSTDFTAVLWGDSHAAQLIPAFRRAVEEAGIGGRIITKAGCPPLPGFDIEPSSAMLRECTAFNHDALQAILRDPSVKLVFIAGRWDSFFNRKADLKRAEGSDPKVDTPRKLGVALNELAEQLRKSGRATTIFGPAPIATDDLPYSCTLRAFFNRRDPALCTQRTYAKMYRLERRFAQALSPHPSTSLVSRLCPEGNCPHADRQHDAFLDDTHLNSTSVMPATGLFSRAIRAEMARDNPRRQDIAQTGAMSDVQ